MAGDETRLRSQEPPVSQEDNYEKAYRYSNEYVERQFSGKVLIKPSDRQLQRTRQGWLLYYLHPAAFPDTVGQEWLVFMQEIRVHSGKHVHQGGVAIFVLEGRGYTVVNGERYDWEEGDLLLLPRQPGGVEHQHFNLDPDKPSRWLAFVFSPFARLGGSFLRQVEVSPDYRA